MNADDSLTRTIGEWQRKHQVADDDPMMATLELVRIYLREARTSDNESAPPSFDDFRGTIELLDRRSKDLIHQSTDLIAELRRFEQNVRRLNQTRLFAQVAVIAVSIVAGVLLGRAL